MNEGGETKSPIQPTHATQVGVVVAGTEVS